MVLRQKYNRITANIIVFSKTRNEVIWVIGSPSKLSGSRLLSALRSALIQQRIQMLYAFSLAARTNPH